MRYFLLSCSVLILLISCKKDSNINSTPNINTVMPNDSIYISKIIEIDTMYAAPLDTVFKFECKYDNQHRVTNFLEIMYYNDGTTAYTDTPKNATVFYNGTDSLPYKATMFSYYTAPSITFETHFYAFSNSDVKQVVYDSINYTELASGNNGLKVKKVIYYNDSTILKESDNNSPEYVTKYNISKANGNIIFQDDGFIVSNQVYDTDPNPLVRLKFLFSEFYRIGAEYNENHYLEFQNNNLLEINDESSIIPAKYKFSYSYNGNGHPVESGIQNLLSNPQRPNKIKYYYTN